MKKLYSASLFLLLFVLVSCKSNDDVLENFKNGIDEELDLRNYVQSLTTLESNNTGAILAKFGDQRYVFYREETIKYEYVNEDFIKSYRNIKFDVSVPRKKLGPGDRYSDLRNNSDTTFIRVTLKNDESGDNPVYDSSADSKRLIRSKEAVKSDFSFSDPLVDVYEWKRKFPNYEKVYFALIPETLFNTERSQFLTILCNFKSVTHNSGYCVARTSYKSNNVNIRFLIESLPLWKEIYLNTMQILDEASDFSRN